MVTLGTRVRLARDLVAFVLLAHVFTAVLYFAGAALPGTIWEPPGSYLFFTGGSGILLAGFLLAWLAGGRKELRGLAVRIVDPRPIRPGWWVPILLLHPALVLLGILIAELFSADPTPLFTGGNLDLSAAPGMLLMLLIVGPLPEEIGWRGALQPRLQTRFSALTAALIVALLWWAWHLPLFLIPRYYAAYGNPPGPFELLVGIVPGSVLLAWLVNNTRGSVLAAILFHWSGNVALEAMQPSDAAANVALLLLWAMAVFVIVRFGTRTLMRSNDAPESGKPAS